MQWLLFLRGVNVGGKNKLPMAEFRDHLATAGCQNVFSYIQSGNVVFDHESRSQKTVAGLVQRVFEQQYEFVPSLFLVTSKKLAGIRDANPFPDAEDEPKFLHFFFKLKPGKKRLPEEIADYLKGKEAFVETDDNIYFYGPNGMAGCKFAERLERLSASPLTARNFRTVQKMLELAHS